MTQIERNDSLLPLVIAEKWGFPLAFHIVEGEYWYAVQDWLRGITGKQDVRNQWNHFKKQQILNPMFASSLSRLSYIASDGKTYKLDFVTNEILIFVAHTIRDLHSRSILREVKTFLSQMLSQSKKATSNFLEGSFNKAYPFNDNLEANDRSFTTINNQSSHLLDCFTGRTKDILKPDYYEVVTHDICFGLWKRSPERLKIQLGSHSVYDIKSRLSPLATSFHTMVDEMVKTHLADRNDLQWFEIRHSVRHATVLVRSLINQAESFLKIDIATGRPLLPQG